MTSIRKLVDDKQSAADDEADSSCLFARPTAHRVKRELVDDEEETDENRQRQITSKITEPPVIIRKIAREHVSVRVEPIGASVKSVSKIQPNRNRIDKIADTLKINLMQKKCLEERLHKQQQVDTATAIKVDVQTKETTASLCQKYRLKLLQNLNKLEMADRGSSLPNLGWLTTYSLSSTGFTPLSPPQSPPSVKVLPVPVAKSNPSMAKPILNPFLKLNFAKTASEEDEADGCHSMKATVAQFQPTKRPNYTFSCLTFLAIESSPKKRLSVKDIYAWIIDHFPFYQSVPSGSWKNSIRHNLTLNQVFSKVDKNLLAMRDFSGKGSLWCINPEHRTTLVEQFNQSRLTNDFTKLSAMPQLQDTSEHSTVHVQSVHHLPKIHCNVTHSSNANFRSRLPTSFSQAPSKPIINPRIAEKIMLTGPHVQISGKVQPKLTNITKVSSLLKAAHSSAILNSTSIDQSNDSYNEMDAVTALLSMKSRASSVPLICVASAQPSTSSAASQKIPTNSIKDSPSSSNSSSSNNTSLNSSINSSSLTSSDTNESPAPKKGRRKQLFKTPTKKVQNDDDTCDSLEQVDTLSDELNHFDDDPIDEPADMNLKKPRLTLSSDVNKVTSHSSQGKKSKKLLVKFSSFNRKPTVSELKPTTKMSEDEQALDELDNDERPLKIDEDQPENPTTTLNTEPVRRSMRSTSKKSKVSGNKLFPIESQSSTNLLLELSRAASMVERADK